MSEARNTAEAFYGALSAGDIEKAAGFIAEDSIEHTPPPMPDFKGGPEGFKQMFGVYRAAFPDLKVEVTTLLVDGDMVAAHGTWTGTHSGSMMGEEPTGQSVTGNFIDLLKIAGGKMVEHRGYGDDAQVMGALGIKPPEG
jgi:predicted ester cyclase